MSQPCIQAETIGGFKAMLHSMDEKLEKHDKREDRMLAALESVAAQGESIRFLVETASNHTRAIEEVFIRIREIELPQNENLVMKILKSSAGIYFFGLFIVSTIISAYAHWDLFVMAWKFYRG